MTPRFTAAERALLLAVRGVGPTVLARLEAAGVGSLDALARQEPAALCQRIAADVGGSCWRNSPMALAAMAGAVAAAREQGEACQAPPPPATASSPAPAGSRRPR